MVAPNPSPILVGGFAHWAPTSNHRALLSQKWPLKQMHFRSELSLVDFFLFDSNPLPPHFGERRSLCSRGLKAPLCLSSKGCARMCMHIYIDIIYTIQQGMCMVGSLYISTEYRNSLRYFFI